MLGVDERLSEVPGDSHVPDSLETRTGLLAQLHRHLIPYIPTKLQKKSPVTQCFSRYGFPQWPEDAQRGDTLSTRCVAAMLIYEKLYTAIQEIKSICDANGSRSQYFGYGSYGYKASIKHHLASSSEVAQLAVQPGSVQDLCQMMKILKKRKVQFAVKGGGHGMAPTFSSTTGIHIAMIRFSKVQYDPKTQRVKIGSGCLWDQVYSELAPTGRNVIGGASSDGVGVGGWLLGGGYSLKSNRHGLGIDNVVAINIVTPDGRSLQVTAEKNRDLFQALRGGGNNFGIVTSFTLKTFAQNPTYGSYFVISGVRQEEFKKALVDFVENEERPEACVVAAFRHELVRGVAEPEYKISIFCVFDAEKPKKKSNLPFKSFARLQESGASWKADPAGWQLGKTNLPLSDLVEVKPQSSNRAQGAKTPSSRPGTPQPRDSVRRKNRDSKGFNENSPPSYGDLYPRRGSQRGSRRDAEDSDGETCTGYFQEMSHVDTYGISSYRNRSHGEEVVDDSDGFGADSDDDNDEGDYGSGNDENGSDDDSDNDSDPFNYDSGNDDPEDDEPDLSDDDGEADSSDDDDKYPVEKPTSRSKKGDSRISNYKEDLYPVMVTKKIDKMGEMDERGRFGCLMISKYTKPLLDKMEEEAKKAASHIKKRGGLSVIIDAWPVHQSIFDNSPPGAAFPHERGEPYGPMLAYFRWQKEEDDEFWLTKLKGTLNRIRVVARNLGLTPRKPAYYNNLSLETVPAHKIYRDNMKWLKRVKAKYDPTDVMGRCGGHKIPLPAAEDEAGDDSDD
ncbi:hypothetical protein PQX77_015676 [Marasmius sp. AFHP31]|nr:hypothetical protein PQX77_015676 [Marasmius sp. AFHP31]